MSEQSRPRTRYGVRRDGNVCIIEEQRNSPRLAAEAVSEFARFPPDSSLSADQVPAVVTHAGEPATDAVQHGRGNGRAAAVHAIGRNLRSLPLNAGSSGSGVCWNNGVDGELAAMVAERGVTKGHEHESDHSGTIVLRGHIVWGSFGGLCSGCQLWGESTRLDIHRRSHSCSLVYACEAAGMAGRCRGYWYWGRYGWQLVLANGCVRWGLDDVGSCPDGWRGFGDHHIRDWHRDLGILKPG